MEARKQLKVGVLAGEAPPRHYVWNVEYLSAARDEAMSILNEAQYHHIADQFKDLAEQAEPSRSETLSVAPVEDFHELRDKGGPLGKLNIRVFFAVDKQRRTIVALGVIKKESDGKTYIGDIVRMRRRKRQYEEWSRTR